MAQPQVPEVPRLPVRPPVEDFDVSQRTDVAKLRKGAIGLGGVLFLKYKPAKYEQAGRLINEGL
jgi:hypothetical protein